LLLRLAVKRLLICYRCKAHFRGFQRNPEHQAFDLHTEEQYPG